MKVSKMLANITPACKCRGYIEEGDRLTTQRGQANGKPQWWVACPDCHSPLGQSLDYPVIVSEAALTRRGYVNESNSNA